MKLTIIILDIPVLIAFTWKKLEKIVLQMRARLELFKAWGNDIDETHLNLIT